MATNLYLDELLIPLCDDFGGTFSSDNIPSVDVKSKRNFIVNLSKEKEVGSHFITLCIRPTFIYYCDSFGKECYNLDILNYMNKLNRDIYVNRTKVQHEKSQMCGFFCALTILKNDSKCKNKTDSVFSTDLLKNDKLCVQHIINVLREW